MISWCISSRHDWAYQHARVTRHTFATTRQFEQLLHMKMASEKAQAEQGGSLFALGCGLLPRGDCYHVSRCPLPSPAFPAPAFSSTLLEVLRSHLAFYLALVLFAT
jgi:hypothetical protein